MRTVSVIWYGLNPENNQINNELKTTLSPNDSILSTNHVLSQKTAIKRTRNDEKRRTQHANMDVRQKLVLDTVCVMICSEKKCKKKKEKKT